MYQRILTYCYMVGMIHNTNQPRMINGESLHGSFTVLPFQDDIWLASAYTRYCTALFSLPRLNLIECTYEAMCTLYTMPILNQMIM